MPVETLDLSYSPMEWEKDLSLGQFEKVHLDILRLLDLFKEHRMFSIQKDTLEFLEDYIQNSLAILTHPQIPISKNCAPRFVFHNSTLSKLIGLTSIVNTDSIIHSEGVKNNPLKKMIFWNHRNSIYPPVEEFFDYDPLLASLWWIGYFYSSPSLANPLHHENLREHLRNVPERLRFFGTDFLSAYFTVTYVDCDLERDFKRHLNREIQNLTSELNLPLNEIKTGNIAIASSSWFHKHSVYRVLSTLIEELCTDYKLTLIELGDPCHEVNHEPFDAYYNLKFEKEQIDFRVFQKEKFDAIIYPDLGLNNEGIFLANLRLAPVQCAMYGHPLSSHGSKIDYYFVSEGAEQKDLLKEHFSETPVLIPGLLIRHQFPEPQIPEGLSQEDPIIITCSWTARKINSILIGALKKIAKKSKRRVVFRLFPGTDPLMEECLGFILLKKDLESILGEGTVELIANLPYKDYRASLMQAKFGLDAYPFGGFNSVIDSLQMGKPVLAWEGAHSHSRFSPYLLKSWGLSELVAASQEEFIDKAVELANNPEYLKSIESKILSADFSKQDDYAERNFKLAMSYLIEKNPAKASDKKIVTPGDYGGIPVWKP